ncbi:tobamovirus multiplication protein 1-like isoform X3 [Carya illinoinensis]|uniref:tobamovirus multiplication protein 1-like isoform X3 n=1 Tax=Carya illinoinensis TaxID=32201 RepID=UPI001C720BDD|nr:tobamovirus multiplication protein 1-like isoform X3 [Carya illinoinensis]
MSVAKSTNIIRDHQLAPAVTLSHVAHPPSTSLMAWMQETKSFVLREGEIQAALGFLSWWDEIDESAHWQRGIYYTLCVCYASVSLVALVLAMVLMDLPGLLFFSTYTLLVLFWAEIYHQARSLPVDKLRPAYFASNGFMYFTQVCIWIFIRLGRSPVSVKAAKLFFSVMSFSVALGFLIYGGRLFFMLRRFPIESRGRQKKLYEVGCVTGICCACFLIRCFVLALAAVDKDADIDVLDHPILNLTYYMLVEIVPSALVLFILRKLPPRRVSEHYQPIS